MKKIVIAGGTGFLGSAVAEYFSVKGFEVVVFGRSAGTHIKHGRFVSWRTDEPAPWQSELEGAELLLNLAGKSVDCRYTEANKKEILASRIDSTRALAAAVKGCTTPPKLWINTASATIYIPSFDKLMTEYTGETGNDFSMSVCKQWEAVFQESILPGTRKAIFRTSIVLGNSGGAFTPLKSLVRTGMGGSQGSGTQRCSWIHVQDFCHAIDWVMNVGSAQGIYNVTAPETVSNKHLMKTIRKAMHIPVGLPIPSWLIKIGAAIVGTEPELVLKSRNVYPQRLLEEGFVFQFPTLVPAIDDLLRTQKV